MIAQSIGNALQAVSGQMCPEIGQIAAQLENMGASRALMTGSGSAVFGVFDNPLDADRAAERMKTLWKRVYRCSTCQQSLVVHE